MQPEPLAEPELVKKLVWTPLKGSQTFVMNCPANMILYHGSRGPGKTDSQLMRFRMRVGMGYDQYWRGIIFDQEYKNLDDLVSKSQRWFPQFDDGARFLRSNSDYKWVWPTGEELLFRTLKREEDYWSYHGQEFPFIGWNELTKYATPSLFDSMMSCNRSSFLPSEHPIMRDGEEVFLPELPLEIFATCNPYGKGHAWVKRKFITTAKPGEVMRTSTEVFNPRTQAREVVVKSQVHIFGSYRENKYLSPEYVAELENMTDINKKKAWEGGDWDIVSGGMFDDVWSSHDHVVDAFAVPYSWTIDRSFDYGSTAPFSVGWWATSDGSDIKLSDGSTRSTVRGDVFRIAEWYGWSGKPNEGLTMLATDIAQGIVQREVAMKIYNRVKPGPADNSIYDNVNGNSIAVDMARPVKFGGNVYNGVHWTRSNKAPGSRKVGWEKMRNYFQNAKPVKIRIKNGSSIMVPRSKAGIFIFRNCKMFIDLVPILPRDPRDLDDADTNAEDHIADETRYRLLNIGAGIGGGKTKGLN